MGLNAFANRCQAIDLPWQSLETALAGDHGKPIMCFMGQSLDAWSWRMADALAKDQEVCDLIHTAFIPVYLNPREYSGAAALLPAGAGPECWRQWLAGLYVFAARWPAIWRHPLFPHARRRSPQWPGDDSRANRRNLDRLATLPRHGRRCPGRAANGA